MVIRRRSGIVLAVSGLLLVVAVIVATSGGGTPAPPPLPGTGTVPRASDPFAFQPGRESQFAQRAVAGDGQPLFTKSSGGVLATAARVASWRPAILAATKGTAIDPNAVEGIVFVESGGQQYELAGNDPASAAGLTQILASTATSLLGLHVDLAADRRLFPALQNAGSNTQTNHYLRELAKDDQRFNPQAAIAATVRYLESSEKTFGRGDLAVVSYHMGQGNLQNVLGRYDGGHPVPYAQLFFDTAPDHNASTYSLLSGFADQSWLYFWRVSGAEQIMSLYRSDRAALGRLNDLETGTDSTALVLHPPDHTTSFADPQALSTAYAKRTLVPLPRNLAALGLRASIAPGTHGVPAALYSGLRPAALDLLLELGARVRALTGNASEMLEVVGTVSDTASIRKASGDEMAASGYQFVLARHYSSRAQADALQAMLDRLQSLDLIGWARRGGTIAVTVAGDAGTVIAHGV